MDDTELPEMETPSFDEGPKKPSGNPNPKRPNPESVGEAISNSKTADMLDG